MRDSIIKGFVKHRSVRCGVLVCFVLFIVLKFTSKVEVSVAYNQITGDHKGTVSNINENQNGLSIEKMQRSKSDVVSLARKISLYNNTVLLSIVNDAYLPFAYSWLCNTKYMNIHRSVLVITTDATSKTKLNKDWPEISVFYVGLDIPKGDQDYSHVGYVRIMIRRTELILALLQAKIDMLLLEFDSVWFTNPIFGFQRQSGVDMLVNPVSGTGGTLFAGGLLYMFSTEKTISLWKKLTDRMKTLEQAIKQKSDNVAISEEENDQVYLSKLIRERYADITYKLLPLDKYCDGQWYSMSENERRKIHPLIINNNWVIGNMNKISRAKQWNHWFLRSDGTCDEDVVKKIVYK